MKKQILFLFLILPFLPFCNTKKKEAQVNEPSATVNPYNSLLVGKWSICSEGSNDGKLIQYNVCPEVVFTPTAVATISFNNIDRETLQWKTNNDTIFLDHTAFTTVDTVRLFPDHYYLVNKTEDSISINLKFLQPARNYFINLSKPKN
jgi:hypothetical protein